MYQMKAAIGFLNLKWSVWTNAMKMIG